MYGAVWAQADLRKILGVAGARVAEAGVAVGRAESRFDDDGGLADEEIRDELREALAALTSEVSPVRLVAA
jgi:chromate reductase